MKTMVPPLLALLLTVHLVCTARAEFDYYATSSSSAEPSRDVLSVHFENSELSEYDEVSVSLLDGNSQQKDGCEADDECCCCCRCLPDWIASADVLFLDRNVASRRVLFTDNFAAGAPALSLDDLDFDFETGYRLGLTRRGRCGRSYEVSFFALDSWSTNHVLAGAPFQFAQNNLYGVNFADIQSVDVDYGTDLYSVEANIRQQHNDRLTWLAGARAVELGEFFCITDFFGGVEMFRTQTRNYLYGGQLGLDLKVVDRAYFDVNVLGKGGVYYVRAKEFSSYTFFGTSGSDAENDVAFLGELAITGSLQLRPNLALRGGYQFAWLDGVAMADEQMDSSSLAFPPNVVVDTDGGVFYHGGFLGLELRH